MSPTQLWPLCFREEGQLRLNWTRASMKCAEPSSELKPKSQLVLKSNLKTQRVQKPWFQNSPVKEESLGREEGPRSCAGNVCVSAPVVRGISARKRENAKTGNKPRKRATKRENGQRNAKTPKRENAKTRKRARKYKSAKVGQL